MNKPIKVISLCILVLGFILYQASVPRLTTGISMQTSLPRKGDGHKIDGLLCVTQLTKKQWFVDSDLISRAAFIFALEKEQNISGGYEFLPEEGKLIVYPILEEQEASITDDKIAAKLEFDFYAQTVTLLNTGQIFPFSQSKFFTVFLEEGLKPKRFVSITPSESNDNIQPEALAAIRSLNITAEQDASGQRR